MKQQNFKILSVLFIVLFVVNSLGLIISLLQKNYELNDLVMNVYIVLLLIFLPSLATLFSYNERTKKNKNTL